MNITESLKIAVKCIKANWMRSVLTMLGIIIGITSVIMIVGAGTGVRDYIVGLIEDMGSNAVLVSVDTTQATENDYITLDDVENIKTKVSGVERCSPMLMGFGNATIDATATEATVMMVGVNSDVQFAMTNTCEYGRFFTDEEYAAEIAMEHHLGLTCDPIGGLVQIPCIERNAVAAMRAINALSLANFLSETSKISFDTVVHTMYETGRDLNRVYRETAEGGLAKNYHPDK